MNPECKACVYCEAVRDGFAYFDFHHAAYVGLARDNAILQIEKFPGLREGKWYRLDDGWVKKIKLRMEIGKEGDPFGDSSSIFHENLGKEDFEAISDAWYNPFFYMQFDDYSESSHAVFPESHSYNQALIYDVGHGNAVRVVGKGLSHDLLPPIWFDYGCDFLQKDSVILMISNYLGGLTSKSDIIVVSHWDLDHTICLKYLSVPVKVVLATSQMPKTKRRMAIIDNLARIGVAVKEIGFARIGEHLSKSSINLGNFEVWHPSPTKTANQQSLVAICKNVESLLLCGDQTYTRICNAISLDPSKLVNIVVSHHGGRAGNKPKNISEFCSGRVIVSTDEKIHGFVSRSVRWSDFARKAEYTYGCGSQCIVVDF